jgi:phage/plasmid-like protein (TIGR03299 family)
LAHGITATDGMAYAGRVPWHGLGVKVEGGAMTAAQAIDAAGMNWTVETEPIYRYTGGTYLPIDGKAATVRKDTGAVLGMVSNKYMPVQNIECFGFFDEVVGQGDAVYHTVGTLWGGRKVWILAHMGNGEWELDNGEKLESYVLLDNSHDGGSALRMRLTPVEVVCANTLAAATVKEAAFYARHTSGIKTRVKEARDLLGLNRIYMERFLAQCNHIADEAFSKPQMEDLTRKLLYLDPKKDMDEQHGVKGAGGLKMMELFQFGVGRKGESRWDAYGAVTEFSDFWKGARAIDSIGSGQVEVVNRRLSENWFGEGQRMRTQAWDILQMPDDKMAKALQPVITESRN